jgi:hypothetical protein
MAEKDEDESPHVNTDETDEEAQDTCPAFDDDLDSEVEYFTIEEDDCVFMTMVHLVDPHHFVYALNTVSRCLAKAFAENSNPKGFQDIVPTSLHAYANGFGEQPSTHSQSATNGPMPLSWSASPYLDSTKSIQ